MPRRAIAGRGQRGAALIAMAALLVVGTSWAIVKSLGSTQQRIVSGRAHDAALLRESKTALIAYAAKQAYEYTENSPGRLPCPEDPSYTSDGSEENDGLAATTCTLPAVGRLPWRTLGLAKPLDSAGEPLWYVVSAGWALPPSSTAISINSNTLGQLTLDGVVPATATTANTIAALIVAPGQPMNVSPTVAQAAAGCAARNQRRASMPPDVRDYLECANATSPADTTFVTTVAGNDANPVINDRVVAITPAEVFDRVEPVVAARIERDVISSNSGLGANLTAGIYNSAQWNASTVPLYPFAATFADPGNVSAFRGTAGNRWGLLPVTRGNCTAGTERCDPSFVAWDTSNIWSITVTKASGTATMSSYDCTASTGTQIVCTVSYSRNCGFSFCSGTLSINITGTVARNVGNAMRSYPVNTSISGFQTRPSIPASLTIASDASVAINFSSGQLQTISCFFFCFGTRTVTIPITIFDDHPFINPAQTDYWWWFFNSNWHQLVYYVVAPEHVPPTGGTAACTTSTTANCIQYPQEATPAYHRAVMILAGRTLTGSARPNATLSDFVDPVNVTGVDTNVNQGQDNSFYRASRSSAYNDRFLVVRDNN